MIRRVAFALILLFTVATVSAPARSVVPAAHAAPVAAHVARPAALFDKTRVVFHLAIAYGVFHHWVYKPFRAGDIGVHHPIKLVKAGLALLFAVHELKEAYKITSHSNSATLKALNSVLVATTNKFESVGTLFHKNPASLTDAQVSSSVNDLNTSVDKSNQILKAPDAPVSQLGNFQ